MPQPRHNTIVLGFVLLGVCAFISWFIVHFGRWQYGSWDYNTLVDTGWRQVLRQRPYVDFPTTTPPGFNLGIALAYAVFGVSWNATLYFAAVFASGTFLWDCWLMARLSMTWPAAIGVSFSIECASMMTGCFWWFNNGTLILAAIFFLSCLALGREPSSRTLQVSYVFSLALLSLMKPNIAGILIVGGILFLIAVADNKKVSLGLSIAGLALAVGLLLITHVSIAGMVRNYAAIAAGRVGAGNGHYGIRAASHLMRLIALFWVAMLSIPLLGLISSATRKLFGHDRKALAIGIFCAFSLVVSLYGLLTNSDVPELECTVLIAAGAVLTFALAWTSARIRSAFVVALVLLVCRDLSYGAKRTRVQSIGMHAFFEFSDNEHRIESGYLKDMRVSSTMIEVEREVHLAKAENPGSIFFGPRLEFNYAVLRLPSPEHLPVLWDPGASFSESEDSKVIETWKQHSFKTLIFLNVNSPLFPEGLVYTYYPKELREVIDNDYIKSASYPFITVYRRRAVAQLR